MVARVTAAADHSRPETHRFCISRQTRSGGGNSSARAPRWVAKYQAPNRLATSASWIERTMTRSRRISSLRVTRLAHARDRRPDLVAQLRVEVIADFAELAGQHEVGRARMRLWHVDAGFDLSRPRRHHDDAVGEEYRLGE